MVACLLLWSNSSLKLQVLASKSKKLTSIHIDEKDGVNLFWASSVTVRQRCHPESVHAKPSSFPLTACGFARKLHWISQTFCKMGQGRQLAHSRGRFDCAGNIRPQCSRRAQPQVMRPKAMYPPCGCTSEPNICVGSPQRCCAKCKLSGPKPKCFAHQHGEACFANEQREPMLLGLSLWRLFQHALRHCCLRRARLAS